MPAPMMRTSKSGAGAAAALGFHWGSGRGEAAMGSPPGLPARSADYRPSAGAQNRDFRRARRTDRARLARARGARPAWRRARPQRSRACRSRTGREESAMASPSDWLGLSGRVAVVTGAASGIGKAVAAALADAGAAVALLDKNQAGCDAVA